MFYISSQTEHLLSACNLKQTKKSICKRKTAATITHNATLSNVGGSILRLFRSVCVTLITHVLVVFDTAKMADMALLCFKKS